jgi:NAD(P)-dependent dehydrogenase (short-subunit alcohol dehydrogenase family)
METLAQEPTPKRIRVHSIAPEAVRTAIDRLVRQIPRAGRPTGM